ncbi:isoprenylcysteine carboxyl methyltransferase family protein [Mycobacterium xenopi 4042]|uniref:Isoprenylcysteine carboxyl methyltransferase family protein n=1 Tax=Mycobacterium xenopi 4042 TaxID=1299334 RepID=X8ALZ2_MYCXE|nr:isoprenylcysteine carboxyl methyltransferase family protein [Mycobacterium xenopi 4042]
MRADGGTRMAQKIAIGGTWLSLTAMFVVSALDHRFGWSSVPTAVCVIGDVLAAVGLAVAMMALVQNSYAGATVRVEAGQQLISTGLYGLVRHPMYTGNVIAMIGIPLRSAPIGPGLRHNRCERACLADSRRGEAVAQRAGRIPRIHAESSLSASTGNVVTGVFLRFSVVASL